MRKQEEFGFNRMILHSLYFTGGAIIAPLLVIGGAGYFLDKYLHKRFFFTLMGIGIAFMITNFLLLRRVRSVQKMIETVADEDKTERTEVSGEEDLIS